MSARVAKSGLLRLLPFCFLVATAFSQNDFKSDTLPSQPATTGNVDHNDANMMSPGHNDTALATGRGMEALIGSGDLLQIRVYGVADLDQEVRVSGNGDVSLPLVDDVHVAGLSPKEAQAVIEGRLVSGGFLLHPHVSVFQKEYATQGVSVLGEVMKPGVYPLLGSRRLFDILSMAGGTTPKAGTFVTITHRDQPERPTRVTLSDETDKSAAANVTIAPGDTLSVSKAPLVYVVGDVHRPSGIPMDNGGEMTVLQAIAIAEGTNPTASLGHARLIRKTPQGPQEIPIALNKMLAAKAPDMQLQRDDIVFVPSSIGKHAARRGLESIVQIATGVAIYHP
jgi:polysaccharide biosynthesis/export protein